MSPFAALDPVHSPYCAEEQCFFDGTQFKCRCGWRSNFDAEFIENYKNRMERFKSAGPKMTNDDELGIAWWNALSERDRARWSRVAGNTGRVKDAWEAFKRASVDQQSGKPMVVKAISMSRPVQAEEWALRQASSIAEKHLPDAPVEKQWELAADIAEALTQARMIFDPTYRAQQQGETP